MPSPSYITKLHFYQRSAKEAATLRIEVMTSVQDGGKVKHGSPPRTTTAKITTTEQVSPRIVRKSSCMEVQ